LKYKGLETVFEDPDYRGSQCLKIGAKHPVNIPKVRIREEGLASRDWRVSHQQRIAFGRRI